MKNHRFDTTICNQLGTHRKLILALILLAVSGAFKIAQAQGTTVGTGNGRIAFTSSRDGNMEIYSMSDDGSGQVNLTNHPDGDFEPDWSPDGRKILFVSWRSGSTYQPRDFYVMNADGSDLIRIFDTPEITDNSFETPTWSHDGTRIIYFSHFMATFATLFVINADGSGQPEAIFSSRIYAEGPPRWSPDGTRIAFIGRETVRYRTAYGYVYVINADGGGRTIITDRAHGDLGWSPDGSRIAFVSNRDGNAEIYVIGASGGNPVRLTNNPAQDISPVWSPDGTKIAFTSTRDGNSEIYVMNADGSNPVRLTNNPARDDDADWQPIEPRVTLPPAPPTLQFSAADYRVAESQVGGASITVTRLGDLSREAQVDYSTMDLCSSPPMPCVGTASERSDYLTAAGTLRFAPGEASKSFNVFVIDDAFVEGDESFLLRLRNAEGAAIARTDALLTITDNDTAPPTANPIDDARFFVRQHYLDFLNREPDQGGFDYWTSEITRCGADAACILSRRIGVSAAFFIEQEYRETGFFIYRFYKTSYGERPTFAQFTSDRSRVIGGAELEANKRAFADSWVQRPEFLARYPASLTGTEFIDALLQTVLQGSGVNLSSEREALIADYTANGSRARIVRLVADNQIFQQAEYNRAFVLTQYFGYLRRDPDQGGYDFWLDVLNNREPNNYRGMVCAFITSREYQLRFSSIVTRTNRDCGP